LTSGIYKRTKHHKQKISLGLLGNKNSLGYKHSLKTRLKMSESHKGTKKPWVKGNPKTQFKKNMIPWNKGIKGKASHTYGRIVSQETREKTRSA